MLDIAEQMINGRQNAEGDDVCRPIPNSGFAVLQVLLCYFEMIAKYEAGYTKEDKSQHYFQKGVESVFPQMKQLPEYNQYVRWLYKHARNGLYHNGATGSRVIISGDLPAPIVCRECDIVLNPHHLAPALKVHLRRYVERLGDDGNVEMRSNFAARFDTDVND